MKARIVRIGNSRGVRIPKALLEQAGLDGEVEIIVEGDSLIIRRSRSARDGWAQTFRAMAGRVADAPLDEDWPTTTRWDEDELGMAVSRFEVWLVNLDPTIGREIKKTRPGVVVSPDELNRHIGTVIVAPMTTKTRRYPTRVRCRFKSKTGQVVLDQIRSVDRTRLVKRLGRLEKPTSVRLLEVLGEMFAP